jgi:GNAT superfamily N-acetyltransferase
VRSADASDAPAIAEVHVASWRAAYRGLLPDEYLDSRTVEVRTQQWDAVLADPESGHVLVAVLGDRVVGFAQARPSGDADAPPATGELLTIYLHPDAWDRGLGRVLHDEALHCLEADGYRSATLWMLSTNERARQFYLRHGWSLIPGLRTQEFGGLVVTDLRFGRSLGSATPPGESA